MLHAACVQALADLRGRTSKPYTNLGNIDSDEFLSMEIREPDEEVDGAEDREMDLEELLSASDILELSLGAFAQDEFLTRDDLFDGGWLFYAVVVEVDGKAEPLAFVRQYNPQRGFDPGRLLSFYSDKLARATDPVFIFDLRFDVIVAVDEVAILSPTAFQRVFADVEVIASEVPIHVAALTDKLNAGLTAASVGVLTDTCRERHRLAARLRKLSRAPHLKLVTRASLRAALVRHGLPADRFGAGSKFKLSDLDDVRQFLDVLEKRYYEEDFTGDHMRADNASPRE